MLLLLFCCLKNVCSFVKECTFNRFQGKVSGYSKTCLAFVALTKMEVELREASALKDSLFVALRLIKTLANYLFSESLIIKDNETFSFEEILLMHLEYSE